MSAHIERAQLLLQQSRPADAEREAGLAIAQAPDHPQAHVLLALSRIEQDKREPALEAARAAVGLAPDAGYFHRIHALVLHRSERNKEALASVHEAIRQDPEDPESFSLLAVIQLNLGDWSAALEAAEQALALDPENTGAANFRSMALVRLGRKDEAMQTVDSALERDPEDAFSHANQGWNRLHKNDPKQALVHFREALRIDPTLEYAREGMIEALKAHNPVYRVMLAYFLWMGRLSTRAQWGVILGIYFGRRLLHSLSDTVPAVAPFVTPLLILGGAFVFLTWTAQPLFNLLLRLHPYGRHALSREQRISSNLIGTLLLIGIASLVAAYFAADSEVWLFGALVSALLTIPVSAAFAVPRGAWRKGLGVSAVLLAFIGVAAIATLAAGNEDGMRLLLLFFGGIFVLSIVSNIGMSRRG